MPLLKPETKRFYYVIWRLFPIAINYRRDRREIRREEGKLVRPEVYRRHGKKAVETFIELGPAYIKLGQLLSVRPDVIPQPYIDEFARLQDEVPPAPFEEVRPILEKELGKPIPEVFDSFDPSAVTGASLGQVYRAKYNDDEVVVKVNRPGIREKMRVDTKVLFRVVPLVGRFIDQSLKVTAQSVVEQFSETIKEEMDYKLEARSLVAIKKNLSSQKDIVIPRIYPEVSSESVLVLQYIGGIKINNVKALDAAGIDRKRLARRVAKIFFTMLLSQDLFHADPHPGNISIQVSDSPDGKKLTKIVLYDFGMTGSLDPETRLKLVRFYSALVDLNSERVVEMMVSLGLLQPDVNRYVIRRGVDLALADMHGQKVEETEVKALLEIANRTIYQFPFRLPKNLVLYMRMLSILEGVCLALDPDFRFVQILGNLLEEEGLVEEAYREEIKDFGKRISKSLDASIDVMPLLKGFLEQNYDPTGVRSSEYRSGKRRERRRFLLGFSAGIGLAGVTVSLFYLGSIDGKVGFVISLGLIVLSTFFSRS